MNRFLVGYDGSSLARDALLVAGRLAGSSGGHVTTVVVDPGDPPDARTGTTSRAPAETGGLAAGCAAEAERLLRALSVPATVEVLPGDPADVLLTAASSGGHHLIALGHHGRGALREMVLGSVTKRVLANAPCPTLVVGKRAASSLGRILAALDGSPESNAACEAAITIARTCGARVILLNVVETASFGGPGPRHAQTTPHTQTSGERDGIRVLAAASRRCAQAGVALEVFQLRGLAAAVIARFAAERRIDLVAIGRSPRSQLDRPTFGGVGDAILRQHDGALLVVAADSVAPSAGALPSWSMATERGRAAH